MWRKTSTKLKTLSHPLELSTHHFLRTLPSTLQSTRGLHLPHNTSGYRQNNDISTNLPTPFGCCAIAVLLGSTLPPFCEGRFTILGHSNRHQVAPCTRGSRTVTSQIVQICNPAICQNSESLLDVPPENYDTSRIRLHSVPRKLVIF